MPKRRITYEPERRPEVANLLRLAALCEGRAPEEIADEIGTRGASALKELVAEALVEHLRPVRERRAAVAGERGYLRSILAEGNARARAIASATLEDVHELMHTGGRQPEAWRGAVDVGRRRGHDAGRERRRA